MHNLKSFNSERILINKLLLTKLVPSNSIITGEHGGTFNLASVSKQSWEESRQTPRIENCSVDCARICSLLHLQDPDSCNAVMFVRETGECHLGTVVLAQEGEQTERVFMIPGTGSRPGMDHIYYLL